jgi:hypothetical protein
MYGQLLENWVGGCSAWLVAWLLRALHACAGWLAGLVRGLTENRPDQRLTAHHSTIAVYLRQNEDHD